MMRASDCGQTLYTSSEPHQQGIPSKEHAGKIAAISSDQVYYPLSMNIDTISHNHSLDVSSVSNTFHSSQSNFSKYDI